MSDKPVGQFIKETLMISVVREGLIVNLKSDVLKITFRKVNGEERVMIGTLREDLLPIKEQAPEGVNEAAKRALSPDLVCLFDLEKQDWRSFRVDSIIKVEKHIEPM